MTFFCNGCEKEKDRIEAKFWIFPQKGDVLRFCRQCRSGSQPFHDVYWDGKPEENLADDPRTGKPITFSSKAEKAAYLKSRGLMEAGDRVHGAPVTMLGQEKKVDSKHEVMTALKKVKEMGRDVRRQEYLKIIQEGRRYA